MEMKAHRFSWLITVAVVIAATAGDKNSNDQCVYTLYVKTGSVLKAGTDAKIGVTLGDAGGKSVGVADLEAWGLMGPAHDYFERAGLDAFTGRGPCLGDGPICRLNLTSDGARKHHGWFCDYVEVTSTGPHRRCSQSIFYVDRWLADDAPPYDLTAVLDGCGRVLRGSAKHGRFVVGNRARAASQ